MTTAKDGLSQNRIRIQQFTAAQQIELFESLKEEKFSGQLIISDLCQWRYPSSQTLAQAISSILS
jgi:hypothetical protein